MTDNKEENWETQEVIKWLINDEYSYTALHNRTARFMEQWVKEENAPQGLYDSFNTRLRVVFKLLIGMRLKRHRKVESQSFADKSAQSEAMA